jgi:CRP/FNR family transcriptional regulator, anaerobic regulatory protein
VNRASGPHLPTVEQSLAAILACFAPVDAPAVAALAPHAERRTFDAGSYLLRGGDAATRLFLVEQGLLREHYVGEDGAEHTRAFLAEHSAGGSLVDLVSGQPATTYLQALETSRVLAIAYRTFDQLTDEYPALERLARRVAELVAVRKTRREYELLVLPASARYEAWLRQHPALDARVSGRLLASYLGITPEHLSRLRAARRRRGR